MGYGVLGADCAGRTPGPSTAIKSNSVQELLMEQEKSIAETHAMLEQFAQRLDPVLSPPPPAGESAGDAPMPPQLSARIRSHTIAIRYLGQKIQGLSDRLEL